MERLKLEADLRNALKNDELELHYQPQVDSTLKRIVGVEALLRWRHQDDGLRFPDMFIPVAEETGMIKELGAWIFKTACHDLKEQILETCKKR